MEKVRRDWDTMAQLENIADKLDEIVDYINATAGENVIVESEP